MKLAKEIAQQLDDDMVDNYKAYGDFYVDQDYVELMIAKKLEPILDALRNLYMKTEVNDYNYCEYDAAEAAIALLEE